MTDTPVVQSGEIPESPDGTPFVHELPALTVGAQMAELLHLRGVVEEQHRLIQEIHAMVLEANKLLDHPTVKMLRAGGKRSPFFGGGGRHG